MDGTTAPATGPADTSRPADPWETIRGVQDDIRSLAERIETMAVASRSEAKGNDLAARVGGLAQSVEIEQLATALAAAQAELQNPDLNRTAKVELKSGGSYEFKFVDLSAILATVRPVLGKHGLSFIQAPTLIGGSTFLVTRLMHASGQWLQTALPLPALGGGRIQDWGGAVTFAKRYSISALLGIAGETEDDDGNAWEGNRAEITDRRGVPTAPPPRQPRGAAARERKAADDAADRRAAAPPPEQPGDPGPSPEPQGSPVQGQAASGAKVGDDAQKALRELPKRLKECFNPDTGEIDIPRGDAFWVANAEHMRVVPQHTVDALVDRYRSIFRRDPPPLDGVTYLPAARADA